VTEDNPLLIRTGLPAYDRIEPHHVAPAIETILARCRAIVADVEKTTEVSWQTLMAPLEEIDLLFEYGWAPIGHLLSVANSEALRAAHDAALPAVVQFGLEFRQSGILYRKLRQLKESPAWNSYENAQRRIVERTLQVAELSGITLQGAARARFNEIETTLSQLATRFSNQLLDATKAWWLDLEDPAAVAGLPDTLRRMTAAA